MNRNKKKHSVKDKEAIERYQERLKFIIENTDIDIYETAGDKDTRIAKAKTDFAFFVKYYFPHYATAETPDFHIEFANMVKKNPTFKGWAMWGRGLAKSVNINVLIPLWLWINDDIKFMVLIGQNYDKACILLDDLKAEFEANQRLINDFGAQQSERKWESGFFITKSGFVAKAIGMGQDPRGLRVGNKRPDYESYDDLETKETLKNPKRQKEIADWILKAAIPAMDTGNRRAVIAQNGFAEKMIFRIIVESKKKWVIHRVDAYNSATFEPRWKQKYPRFHYRDIEDEIGSLEARSEYNNQPHTVGKMFLDEYFQWSPIPKLKDFDALVGRWDVAYGGTATSDFNAIRIWGIKDGRKYLIDCFVKQSVIALALDWIADFQKNLPKGISIQIGFESQFWNETVYDNITTCELRHNITLNLVKIDRDTRKKYERIIEMLPDYQTGKVYYNEALKSHNDTAVGTAQLKAIEPGYSTKDDAPDADKYAFDYLDKFKKSKGSKSVIVRRQSQSF